MHTYKYNLLLVITINAHIYIQPAVKQTQILIVFSNRFRCLFSLAVVCKDVLAFYTVVCLVPYVYEISGFSVPITQLKAKYLSRRDYLYIFAECLFV